LSDRQDAENGCVLADVADRSPVEPLSWIPDAEQSEYDYAACDYTEIGPF
jgi:hypothetical protein